MNVVDPIHLWSPLHVAVIRDFVPCVQVLLTNGAVRKKVDIYGDRPFDCAAALRGQRRKQMQTAFREDNQDL